MGGGERVKCVGSRGQGQDGKGHGEQGAHGMRQAAGGQAEANEEEQTKGGAKWWLASGRGTSMGMGAMSREAGSEDQRHRDKGPFPHCSFLHLAVCGGGGE